MALFLVLFALLLSTNRSLRRGILLRRNLLKKRLETKVHPLIRMVRHGMLDGPK